MEQHGTCPNTRARRVPKQEFHPKAAAAPSEGGLAWGQLARSQSQTEQEGPPEGHQGRLLSSRAGCAGSRLARCPA